MVKIEYSDCCGKAVFYREFPDGYDDRMREKFHKEPYCAQCKHPCRVAKTENVKLVKPRRAKGTAWEEGERTPLDQVIDAIG